MRTIYQDIATRLHEAVPALRYIDLDTGQLEVQYGETQRPPVAYPCALVGINITSATDLYEGVQDCTATVIVRVAQDSPFRSAETAAHANNERRDIALAPYDLVAEVYKALQGWSTDRFMPLSRFAQAREANSKVFCSRIEFRTEFEDYSAEV